MEKKTRIYVCPDGTVKMNPEENPKKPEFVIESKGTLLHVESPYKGIVPTEAQVVSVKEFVADWFNNRYTVFDARNCKEVKTKAAFSEEEGVAYIDIVSTPGKMNKDQVNRGSGTFISWIDALGTKEKAEEAAKADNKKAGPEAGAAAGAAAAAATPPKDEGKNDEKSGAAAAATPPKDEGKPGAAAAAATPPKDEGKPGAAAATPPKNEGETKKPTKRFPELLWDPDKGVDENIRDIMGEP